MSTAVLDVGKTNVKFVVFGEGGTLLYERQIPNASLADPPYPHVDVQKIWNFLGEELRQTAKRFKIKTLIPTTHGASCAVMNEHGLVLPIMDYEFTSVEDITSRYDPLRDAFNQSYSPAMPAGLNVAKQLAWQKFHLELEFAKVTMIVGYPQYWVWRLTGQFAFDISSMGAHTDLWRPVENRPTQLAQTLGFDKLLAPIQPPWTKIGLLNNQVAEEFGVSPNIEILCGIHDSNAALLPYLASRKTPFTVLSTGTWVVIMAIGHSLSSLKTGQDMYANIDAEGRPIACLKFMGGREFANIVQDCKSPEKHEDVQHFIDVGIFALPSFSPNGGPFAARKGEFIGNVEPHQKTSLATFYSALMCAYALELLQTNTGDLLVDGSFAQNHLLCEIIAALRSGQNLYVAKDQAGTARGAALLATWGEPHDPPETHLVKPAALNGLAAYYEKWKSLIT